MELGGTAGLADVPMTTTECFDAYVVPDVAVVLQAARGGP